MKATIIITSFKEPNLAKAIKAAQNQKTKYEYNIIVSTPDSKVVQSLSELSVVDPRINVFQDEGKGKVKALNSLIKNIESDILILTDGDVYINKYAVENIMTMFEDKNISCLTGRPVPLENKSTKFGYFANFLFDAAHEIRKRAFEERRFIECSGYLFAFRNNFIKEIPLDIAEDCYIPAKFYENDYSIGYAPGAQVFVRNVDNYKDWFKQKMRTTKAHNNFDNYINVEKVRKVKSFSTELKGITKLFTYPSNLIEFVWTLELIAARGWMWVKVIIENTRGLNKYGDNWARVESTK